MRVDDPGFDLRWHIRNTAPPGPGGREELKRLVARVMGARMDRGQPLWEHWFGWPPYPSPAAGSSPRRCGGLEQLLPARPDRLRPEAGERVTAMSENIPFAPVALGIRLAIHFPQRSIVTVTTNVPGPRTTLYGLGRKMEELMPFVPIADRGRVGVAMYSYQGTLTFGITGDYDTVPHIEVLASGIASSMDGLLAAAAHQPA